MKMSSKEFQKISKKKHKYRANRCEIDDIKFSSRMEKDYYKCLKSMMNCGEIKFFLRQVPFYLPGNTKYVVDFVIFWHSGKCEFIDVKGYDTPLSKLKRKQVEALYPIKINVVKKQDLS